MNDDTGGKSALNDQSGVQDVGVLIEYLRQLSAPGSPGDQAAEALERQAAEIERLRAKAG